MKVAIMQPYFFPYVGYFQLIKAVDLFIIYDNIKYTKKGWINRNRFLRNGRDAVFTLPLKHDADALEISHRRLSPDFKKEKLLHQFRAAYQKAPYFGPAFPVIEKIIRCDEQNLFTFLRHSLIETCRYLGVPTKIATSSELETHPSLRRQARVVSLCKDVGADVYINPAGGETLYSKEAFHSDGIDLRLLRPKPFEYRQFGDTFVPWLSIIDAIMFNPTDVLEGYLTDGYELQ